MSSCHLRLWEELCFLQRVRVVFFLPARMYDKHSQGFCIGHLAVLWPVWFYFHILSQAVIGGYRSLV